MSIHLIDGPTLLRCDFTRNITKLTKAGEKVDIEVNHASTSTVSDDKTNAQTKYEIKCNTEKSPFHFLIIFGCAFKLTGFTDAKKAHDEVNKLGKLVLLTAIREFLADLTRRTGQTPLLLPYPDLSGELPIKVTQKKPKK